MDEMFIEDISIIDYGSGGIFFYKIQLEKDFDIEQSVLNLMDLKGHKESNCHWSVMCMNDIINNTNTIITHQELKAMENK
jgi:hypothetical protein|tara:strand:+ start:552 stop:791 length:240 start_codon:yes stop_codon:yes gene_type:complete